MSGEPYGRRYELSSMGGGPCGRLAAGFEVSATDILFTQLPGLIIGLVCCILIALYYAKQEKKRGAGLEKGIAGGLSCADKEDAPL